MKRFLHRKILEDGEPYSWLFKLKILHARCIIAATGAKSPPSLSLRICLATLGKVFRQIGSVTQAFPNGMPLKYDELNQHIVAPKSQPCHQLWQTSCS
jgi:hypothetical protein